MTDYWISVACFISGVKIEVRMDEKHVALFFEQIHTPESDMNSASVIYYSV